MVGLDLHCAQLDEQNRDIEAERETKYKEKVDVIFFSVENLWMYFPGSLKKSVHCRYNKIKDVGKVYKGKNLFYSQRQNKNKIWVSDIEAYTAFTPSKSRHRVHFVILMMTKD